MAPGECWRCGVMEEAFGLSGWPVVDIAGSLKIFGERLYCTIPVLALLI